MDLRLIALGFVTQQALTPCYVSTLALQSHFQTCMSWIYITNTLREESSECVCIQLDSDFTEVSCVEKYKHSSL